MPIHITMNDAVTKGAEYLLSRQQISDQRKNQIMPATKYNLLVKTFNVSSVLLVAAAVCAVFLAITSSFVFLSFGLFLRWSTEKELEKYTVPLPPRGWNLVANMFQTNLLRHAVHQTTDAEKVTNIFQHVGLPQPEGWSQTEADFLEFAAWRNTIEIPDVIEQQQEPPPPVGEAVEQGGPPIARQGQGLGGMLRAAVAVMQGNNPPPPIPSNCNKFHTGGVNFAPPLKFGHFINHRDNPPQRRGSPAPQIFGSARAYRGPRRTLRSLGWWFNHKHR